MAIDKRFISCLLLFCFISTLFTIHNTHASGPSVNIEIEASTHANMYYEVLYDGKRIDKDIEFELFNEKGELIGTYRTNNGILLIKKVPFGSYVLKPKGYEKTFRIQVDREYLKTQHILKPLELKEKTGQSMDKNNILNPQTGDNSHGVAYLIIFTISGLLLTYIVLKARGEKNEP